MSRVVQPPAVFSFNGPGGPGDDRFDRIARLATLALRVPIAAISMTIGDRTWYRAVAAPHGRCLPDPELFCAPAFCTMDPLIVSDARDDPRFAPATSAPAAQGIRFFASYPLSGPGGERVGGLCVFDIEPRDFDDAMVRSLADLARLVETELHVGSLSQVQSELTNNLDSVRRQLLRDELTQTWNRSGILEILTREFARARRQKHRLGVALVDLDHFKLINDHHGHLVGDRVLQTAAERMTEAVRPYDAVGRYGGEEFLIVIVEHEPSVIATIAERIRRNIAGAPVATTRKTLPITASVGVAYGEPQASDDPANLVHAADEALCSAKRAGRNRVVVAPSGGVLAS
ncbi:MAG: diguanylate cyclase [Gammaproteobacteria bacterium]